MASAEGRKWKLVLHEKEFETQKLIFIEIIANKLDTYLNSTINVADINVLS